MFLSRQSKQRGSDMGGIGIWQLIIVLVLLPIAFLPTIIAFKKSHKHKIPILLVNVVGGLIYGLGWIVGLVWCFMPGEQGMSKASIERLSELSDLVAKGVITQAEFDEQKAQILNSGG